MQPTLNNDNIIEQTQRQTPIPPAAPPTIQGPSNYTPEYDAYNFGWHSLWAGIRFLAFSILTLLAVALIFIVFGFFLAGFVLFPFAEIATGFARCSQHWKRFVSYFGAMFNKISNFVDGLWNLNVG